MNKRTLIPFGALILGILAAGCSAPKHVHALGQFHAKDDATCTASGLQAYYECSGCDALLDVNANAVTLESLTIAPKGHAYGDTWTRSQNPTCTEEGSEYRNCPRCEEAGRETRSVAHLGHRVVPVARVEATCTDSGHAAYYKCDRVGCGQFWSAAEEANPIANINAWLAVGGEGYIAPTGNHVYEERAVSENLVSPADCSHAAVYKKSCACGQVSTETFTYGDPLGHDYGTLIAKVDSTCTEDGFDAHYQCGRCSAYFDAAKNPTTALALTIARGHHLTHEDDLPATFASAGHVDGYTCSGCGKHFSDAQGTQEITDWDVSVLSYEELDKTVFYDLSKNAFDGCESGLEGYTYVLADLSTSISDGKYGTVLDAVYAVKEGATSYKMKGLVVSKVIKTGQEFSDVCATLEYGYFVLGNDIPSVMASSFEGKSHSSRGFYGTIDGRGHKILELTTADQAKGLFCGVNYYSNTFGFGRIKDLEIVKFKSANTYGLFGYRLVNMQAENLIIRNGKYWQTLLCGVVGDNNNFKDCVFDLGSGSNLGVLYTAENSQINHTNTKILYTPGVEKQVYHLNSDSERIELEGVEWLPSTYSETKAMNSTNFSLQLPFTDASQSGYQLWTRQFATGTIGGIEGDYAYGQTGTKFGNYNGMKVALLESLAGAKLTGVTLRMYLDIPSATEQVRGNVRLYRSDTELIGQTDNAHYFAFVTLKSNEWVETYIDASKVLVNDKFEGLTILNEQGDFADPSRLIVGAMEFHFSNK